MLLDKGAMNGFNSENLCDLRN